MLRIGLHQLTCPKVVADDWAIILDHTCQLGNQKCLIVLGIRLSHWRTLGRPLTLQDMTLLMVRVVESSTGLLVQKQLTEVQAEIGTIAAIVSDQGSDLVKGANLFSENPPDSHLHQEQQVPLFDADQLCSPGITPPLILKDFSHASSHLLKNGLEADPKWKEFLSQCGKCQPRVKQTLWGALAPPTQKVKGRYMNIGEFMEWGPRMLDLLSGVSGQLPEGIDRSMLKLKYGWVEQYRDCLSEWMEQNRLREVSLQVIRVSGYSNKSVDEIHAKQVGLQTYESSRRLASELMALAREQCERIPPGYQYPGSSEVIESLIGKSKELQGQHSRGGFTKMLLAIGASMVKLSENVVESSLGSVRERDIRQWCKTTLGTTLNSMRRMALPRTKAG